MNTRDVRVMSTRLPGCIVVIDRRRSAWYVVDKASRSVLDYGGMGGIHPGFLDHVPAAMHHNGG